MHSIYLPDKQSPIVSFAWHPEKFKFAVALRNDNVYIYDMNAQGA
jgi:hypothetical protein